MTRQIRRLVGSLPFARKLYAKFRTGQLRNADPDSLNQQLQQIIINQYQESSAKGTRLYQSVSDAGFRCYSQFEEDGIILYILAITGMKTRKVVEMCCGNGIECMATNLILNHGYQGFLFDGQENNVETATHFFAQKKDCLLMPPILRRAWITRENVNDLLRQSGVGGEVDLLSLDLDGNDYHIWEAISEINPRLCVFETNNAIPGDRRLTIPYDPNFNCWEGVNSDYRSVSLPAMKALSGKKGYRLIGVHRHGFNAFFLRNDLGQSTFPEVTVGDAHSNAWTRKSQLERWPPIKDMNWLEV